MDMEDMGTASRPPTTATSYDFSITIIDIYTLDSEAIIPRSADSTSPALSLVQAGYLGSTPVSPSFAVSLKTLELFRRLRLRKPSFSVEAFAKVICDLYAVSPNVIYAVDCTKS